MLLMEGDCQADRWEASKPWLRSAGSQLSPPGLVLTSKGWPRAGYMNRTILKPDNPEASKTCGVFHAPI